MLDGESMQCWLRFSGLRFRSCLHSASGSRKHVGIRIRQAGPGRRADRMINPDTQRFMAGEHWGEGKGSVARGHHAQIVTAPGLSWKSFPCCHARRSHQQDKPRETPIDAIKYRSADVDGVKSL